MHDLSASMSRSLLQTSSCLPTLSSLFFFTATATTDIYTLSLHDALPILPTAHACCPGTVRMRNSEAIRRQASRPAAGREACRSEEHTSELQSLRHLVCRLLLEKKKKKKRKK